MGYALIDNENFFIIGSPTQLPINITRAKSVHKNLLLSSNNEPAILLFKNCRLVKTKARLYALPYHIISMGCKDKHSVFIVGGSELLKGKGAGDYMIPSTFTHLLKNRCKPYKK